MLVDLDLMITTSSQKERERDDVTTRINKTIATSSYMNLIWTYGVPQGAV